MEDVIIDGWYKLAAAVVKGLPADDPELAHWRAVGHRIRARMGETPATVTAARRPGHMDTSQVETNSRISTRGSRRGSARISARTA